VALDLGGGVTLEFVHIPAGSFTMGSPPAERDAFERAARKPLTDEGQHPVRISRDFYLGKYPVTQDQYLAVTGTNPSYFSPTGRGKDTVVGRDTGQFPVDSVSWEDAVGFCDRLSRRSGRRVDLPTEAEWEYACRAGTTTVFYFGDSLDGTRANCDGRYPFGTAVPGPFLNRPTPVGAYAAEAPHPWGLCDMHGNVWQWCRDWYDPDYYRRSPAVDPVCSDGDRRSRVLRGGSWDFPAWCCRSAFRLDRQPTAHFIILGFRVALRPE
jgi:formylglycine-generating enzyme required for sulfatase activity